jgi:UDP-sugar transporter A1/2/3
VIVQLPASDKLSYATIFEDASKFAFPRSFHEVGQAAQHAADEVTKRSISAFSKRSATYEGIDKDLGHDKQGMNYSLGCFAVLTASVISGLTGVYFEKVLKDSSASITVWTRNVQLSFYSLFPALLIGVVYKDGGEIAKEGFFVGYNSVVWTAIAFQALGGVLVAMCINYADNIAKNFATSISIILSFLFSVWFFDFNVTFNVSFSYPREVPQQFGRRVLTQHSLLLALQLSSLQHTCTALMTRAKPAHHPSTLRATRRRRSTTGTLPLKTRRIFLLH